MIPAWMKYCCLCGKRSRVGKCRSRAPGIREKAEVDAYIRFLENVMATNESFCTVCFDEFNDVFGFGKCTRSSRGNCHAHARVAAALAKFEAAHKIPDAAIAITRLIHELRRHVAN